VIHLPGQLRIAVEPRRPLRQGGVADRWDGITVDVLGASCPAERHAHAVYDPENLRPRS
jgi:hypothetical protein